MGSVVELCSVWPPHTNKNIPNRKLEQSVALILPDCVPGEAYVVILTRYADGQTAVTPYEEALPVIQHAYDTIVSLTGVTVWTREM